MIEVRFHKLALVAFATAVLAGGCGDDDLDDVVVVPPGGGSGSGSGSAVLGFRVTSLVTSSQDPDLINPWGIVPDKGLFWIADNGTGKVSTYDGAGRTSPQFPTGHFSLGEGITGVARVASASDASPQPFLIPCNSDSQMLPAELVFASEDGFLIAINSTVGPAGARVVDRSSVGANYKGVARIDMASGPVLLAADFVNARVDMFDSKFQLISPAAGTLPPFTDPQLPAGWGPFNVQTFNGRAYVMEAKQSLEEAGDEEKGAGLGAVAIFDANGVMVARITSTLFNAPWGIAIAPGTSTMTDGINTLFIGNFGDGRITRLDATSYREIDQLFDTSLNPIALEGLWGLALGGEEGGDPNALYVVAGPADETAGLYARINRAQ